VAKVSDKRAKGWQVARLRDMSGGLNLAVAPDLLSENEAAIAEFIDFGQKGTLRPASGRLARFAEAFSGSHVTGGHAYYKKDLTSRLLASAGTKLFADLPHFVHGYDTQQEWETGERTNIDSTSEPGKIKPTDNPSPKAWDTEADFNAGTLNQAVVTPDGNVELALQDSVNLFTPVDLSDLTVWAYSQVEVVQLSAGAVLVAYYHYTGSEYRLRCRVATVASDGTITLGDYAEAANVRPIYIAGCLIDANKVLLVFLDITPNTVKVAVATVSGTTVSLGTPVDVGVTGYHCACAKLDTNKALIAYRGPSTSYPGQARVVTVSGATPSIAGASNFEVDETYSISVCPLDVDKALVCYMNDEETDDGQAVVASVSGTTITWGSRIIFESGALHMYDATACAQLGTDKALVIWLNTARAVKAAVFTVSGTTITVNSAVTLVTYTDAYARHVSAALVAKDKVCAAWRSGDSPYPGLACLLKVSGTTVSANPAVTFKDSSSPVYIRACPVDEGFAVIANTATTETLRVVQPVVRVSPGTWTSDEYDAGETFGKWVLASSVKTVPTNTTVTLEYRAKPLGGEFGAWTTDITSLTDRVLQARATLSTTETNLTPYLDKLEVTWAPPQRWISPAIDVAAVEEWASGKVSHASDVPGQAKLSIETRTSADQLAWSDWVAIDVDGTIMSPQDNYLQVRVGFAYANLKPTMDWLKVLFGDEPNAVQIFDGLTDGVPVNFETFMDICTIWNGVDAPRKYDGETVSLLGGSPPAAKFAVTHQNRLWAFSSQANPSRLWFSDLLDPESWPVLNFIDIQPDDGDHITGAIRMGEVIVITKQHSTWILVGDAKENYAVIRRHASIGALSHRSLCLLPTGHLAFVADDGVWMTDLAEFANITERLRPYWDELNHRRLSTAASAYDQHRLYVAVPYGASIRPNRVIVLDLLRKAFEIRPTWNVSCWVHFREQGLQKLLAMDSTQGQAWYVDGPTEDGAVIPARWESKAFNFKAPEQQKRIGRVWLTGLPDGVAGEVDVRFRRDVGSDLTDPVTVSFPATTETHLAVIYPSQVGVALAKNLSVHLEWKTLAARTQVHSIAFEYLVLGLKEE